MRASTQAVLIALFTLILSTTATHAHEHGGHHSSIEQLYASWRNAVETGSIEDYVNVLHDDISLRPPGVSGIDGRSNYAAFLIPVFATASYEIQIDTPPKISVLGKTAIVEYDYTITRNVTDESAGELAPGAIQAATTSAHYIDVVTQDSKGNWRVRLHSWSDYISPNNAQ
jgi:ketosteroid isomerase-like protein